MRVGDVLEWFAGAAFAIGTYLATQRVWAAVLVIGVELAYLAQCHGATPFPRIKIGVKIPKLRRKRAKLEE